MSRPHRLRPFLFLFASTLSCGATATFATDVNAISINFQGNGIAMGAAETAGVVPKSNWNNATGKSSSAPLALSDELGNPTAATATWSSDVTWVLPILDAPGNKRMMSGYIDTTGKTTTTVTVANLPQHAGGYNVYVYMDSDDGGDAVRTGAYQISGPGITPATIQATDAAVNFSGTFTQANGSNGNYVVFTIVATGFTLTATPVSSNDTFLRAPVNGIQIVPLGDFSLDDAALSPAVNPGGSAVYTVTAAAENGFNGTVTLSAAGLPSGAIPSFDPPTIAVPGSSTLTISTNPSISPAVRSLRSAPQPPAASPIPPMRPSR